MTWTSDYGTQRAFLKGLDASGLKGLELNCYSVLFFPGIAMWLSKMSCLVCVDCDLLRCEPCRRLPTFGRNIGNYECH
jgi:hypothetical protein